MRMGEDQVLLAEDGDVIELTATSAEITGKVPVGTVLIDGSAGAVQQEILRDRRHLSGDGLLIPVLVIHRASGELASPPEMVSRGFTWFGDREGLLEECVRLVTRTVRDASAEERADWGALRSRVQDALRRFLRKRTRRPPMILPIIIET
jgi:ribonuclease J